MVGLLLDFCGAGPADEIGCIIKDLQQEGVFVREVETLGLAYHSPALEPLLPFLKKGRPSVIIAH